MATVAACAEAIARCAADNPKSPPRLSADPLPTRAPVSTVDTVTAQEDPAADAASVWSLSLEADMTDSASAPSTSLSSPIDAFAVLLAKTTASDRPTGADATAPVSAPELVLIVNTGAVTCSREPFATPAFVRLRIRLTATAPTPDDDAPPIAAAAVWPPSASDSTTIDEPSSPSAPASEALVTRSA